jgi:hypothetical protein
MLNYGEKLMNHVQNLPNGGVIKEAKREGFTTARGGTS